MGSCRFCLYKSRSRVFGQIVKMRLLFFLANISCQLLVFLVILFGTQLIELFEILYKVVLVVKTALKYQILPVDLFVFVMSHILFRFLPALWQICFSEEERYCGEIVYQEAVCRLVGEV